MNPVKKISLPENDLLVLEAQAGNVRAFNLLFTAYNKPLLRFAFNVCGDEQLSKDAVQEAWITLSKTLSKLKDPRGFKVWAYKTVKWRVTDQVRRRGVIHAVLDDCERGVDAPAMHAEATSSQLKAHIARLPPDDRQTLTLFYLGELTLIEIAAVLDIPVGTVKSRLYRARTQLREQMSGELT